MRPKPLYEPRPASIAFHNQAPRNEAINLSGTVNRPRRRAGGVTPFNCFYLFRWIGTQVDFGGFHVGMTEPKRDLAQVASCLEYHHRAAVSKQVR